MDENVQETVVFAKISSIYTLDEAIEFLSNPLKYQYIEKQQVADWLMELKEYKKADGTFESSSKALHDILKSDFIRIIHLLNNRDIEKIIRELTNEEIIMANKEMPNDVWDKFLQSMSKRRQKLMTEDFDYLEPIRVNDGRVAQRKILSIIYHLMDTGAIILDDLEESKLCETQKEPNLLYKRVDYTSSRGEHFIFNSLEEFENYLDEKSEEGGTDTDDEKEPRYFWNYRVLEEVKDGISNFTIIEVYYEEGKISGYIDSHNNVLSGWDKYEDLKGTWEFIEGAFNIPVVRKDINGNLYKVDNEQKS